MSVKKQIQELNEEGKLQSLLHKLRKELDTLYKDYLSGKLKDTSKLRKLRKDIARVLTKINQLKKQNAA